MGALNLPESSCIYLDTSAVIYSVERVPDYFSLLEPMWQKLQDDEIAIASSELTLLESLVLPLRNNNTALVSNYEQLLLGSKVQLIPISQTILRDAAQLRASTNLKTPDAIHAATALSENCSFFLTNDSGFRNVSGLPVVVLRDVLVS
jgi:predicted nucleic acid-binding protein